MRNFIYLEHGENKDLGIHILVVEHKGKPVWMYSRNKSYWFLLNSTRIRDKQPTQEEDTPLTRLYNAAVMRKTLDKEGLTASTLFGGIERP